MQLTKKCCHSYSKVCHIWSTFFGANGNRMNQTWINYNFLVGTEKWHWAGRWHLPPVVLRAICKVMGEYGSRVVIGKFIIHTLYNVLLRMARNLLETRENVKILTHSFYHTNLDWFSWEWSKKKFFFWRKKFKMADFSKWPFFKIANPRDFFAKILQIDPCISRIDWCEAH